VRTRVPDGLDDGGVFAHRTRPAVARAAAVAALVVGLVVPAAAAHAAQPLPSGVAAAPKPAPSPGPGPSSANDGAGGGRITFGMTTASGGTTDARGFIAVNAPAGSVLYDNVAVINLSDAPLAVDVYAADVTNGSDGALDVAASTDKKQLAGGWVTLGETKVDLAAQSSKAGPGFKLVPVTITIPKDAEPGDHLAAVLASVTAQGKPGENAPAVNLEHRVGVRVYVTVQGSIRPGLSIKDVRTHFRPGSTFGPGSLDVEYTLTNSGNVRVGVKPSVRATGPFGTSPHTADGTAVAELLPHSSVTQKVSFDGVLPAGLENVVVSAAAVAAQGGSDPGIGTVHASSWTWLWTWVLPGLLLVAGGVVTGFRVRRRRSRPGVWGPPEELWAASTPAGPSGDGPSAATAAAAAPPTGDTAASPATGTETTPDPEPVR